MAASKVRSAPKLAKKKQLQLVLPGTLGRHRERSGKHLASRHRETSVRHRETRLGAQGKASGTRPRSRQHLASDCRDWGAQGTGGVGVTGDTGRHRRDHDPGVSDAKKRAGDTTPEPASQHLACDRRDWETQGDKQETRETQGDKRETPWSQGYSINRRHTFPFSIPQVRTPMLRCLGKNRKTTTQRNTFHRAAAFANHTICIQQSLLGKVLCVLRLY